MAEYQPTQFEKIYVPYKMWGQPLTNAQPAAAPTAAPNPNTTPSNAFSFNGVNPLTTPKANAPMLGIQSPMAQGAVGENTNPSLMNPFVSQFLAARGAGMPPVSGAGMGGPMPQGQPMGGMSQGQPGGVDLASVFKMLGIQQ